MLILPAYAKLNLSLEVVARRDDGWHELDSVIVLIDWHDLVGVTLVESAAPAVTLRVGGPAATGVPGDGANLAARAVGLLLERVTRSFAAAVWLEKRVPHAAGLGGGSADAAAALRAAARALARAGVALDPATLYRAALEVGSDVPVFVAGGAQRVRGRGEALQPLHAPALHAAVVIAGRSATSAAFAALEEDDRACDGRSSRLAAALDDGAPLDDALLGSALEPGAVRANPELGAAIERVRAVVPERRWHLTGSGGALFAMAATALDAAAMVERLSAAGFIARRCRTLAT